MDSDLISICIPAYNMNGIGAKYLKQLLQTVEAQTYQNYEVIISDHSNTSELKDIADSFNNKKFKHYFNKNNLGSSSGNVNFAIEVATSEKIKVMFQDDFFTNINALHHTVKSLCINRWTAFACVHYNEESKQFYRPHYPFWQDNIKKGENTIGCPSVIAFNKSNIFFDTDLLWFMDTDFYYRMFKMHGPPAIDNTIIVGIRDNPKSVSNTLITDEVVLRENKILKQKFNF